MADPLEPIAVSTPPTDDDVALFGDYRFLYPIFVEGRRCLVPEGNSVLRALQFLEIKQGIVKMDWARYCWNDTQGCCEMNYHPSPGAQPTVGRACKVAVAPGLDVVTLPKGGRVRHDHSDE